ncbi:MAG: hypothetical protein WA476_11950 [Acidobacteriaceae bacterium]
MATRLWPIPAAAAISLGLFWAIASAFQQITRWALTHAVGHHSPFLTVLPVFATFIPSMAIVGRRQKQKQRPRQRARGEA